MPGGDEGGEAPFSAIQAGAVSPPAPGDTARPPGWPPPPLTRPPRPPHLLDQQRPQAEERRARAWRARHVRPLAHRRSAASTRTSRGAAAGRCAPADRPPFAPLTGRLRRLQAAGPDGPGAGGPAPGAPDQTS